MPDSDHSFLGKRIFVAGHRGMVGSTLLRRLSSEGCEIMTTDRNLDLRRQRDTEDWMADARPQIVFLAAAKVGGILANRDHPADFVYDNLMIGANVMEASRRVGVEKLVFLGSSCIYPKHAPQPIPEEALLTGPLEPTNDAYAIAKIAGIRMAKAYRTQYGCRFICAQPCNVYGPRDNFNLEAGHVLPALMRKAHEAKLASASEMVVWGSGSPLREFLHVDDLADALVFLAKRYDSDDIVNIGSGEEVSIRDLATLIVNVVGFDGRLVFDASKPDGTPRKLVDVSRLHATGWRHTTSLAAGLRTTYEWFLQNQETLRLNAGTDVKQANARIPA